MRVIDILTHGNFETVIVMRDGKPIETMSKGMAILSIGHLEMKDFWIEFDGLGCLYIGITLKEV